MPNAWGTINRRISMATLVDFLNAHPPVVEEFDAAIYGDTGDGDTDDTAAIVSAMTAAHTAYLTDGGVRRVVVRRGTHRINPIANTVPDAETPCGLNIPSGVILSGERGAVLEAIPVVTAVSAVVYIGSGATNCGLEDFAIVGERYGHLGPSGGADNEFGHGVAVFRSTDVVLRRLDISACWGDGMCLGNDGYVSIGVDSVPRRLTIEDVNTNTSRRNAVSITGAHGLRVRGGRWVASAGGTNPRCGLDIESLSGAGTCTDLLFEGVTFESEPDAIHACLITGAARSVRGLRFSNCTFRTQADDVYAPTGIGRSTLQVVNGTVDGWAQVDGCRFVGPTNTLAQCIVTNFTMYMDTETLNNPAYLGTDDAPVVLDGGHIDARRGAALAWISGSTTLANRKIINNVTGEHNGGGGIGGDLKLQFSDYCDVTGGGFIHTGAAVPAPGFATTLDTSGKTRVVDVYLDAELAFPLMAADGLLTFDPLAARWGQGPTTDRAVASMGAANSTALILGVPGAGEGTQRLVAPLSAAITTTLNTTNAFKGARFRFTRTAAATGAFAWHIGTVKDLTAENQWCDVVYDGTAWRLDAAGSL